ncbi:hypothetical protein [Citrobacter koseri]|uniref:hypothetical protein n=1 Tax=Citrobacter koseri TaxID=545 RepID=UPI002E32ECC1|nr:hypothetical protein [Citrobacter koseri]
MNEQELKDTLLELIQWHQKRVENCRLVIDNTDVRICLKTNDDQEFVIEADTQKARLVRLGMMLALEQFTPFPVSAVPVSVTLSDDEEDAEDE